MEWVLIALGTVWCSSCGDYVDYQGASCAHCGGPTMLEAHPSECRWRRNPHPRSPRSRMSRTMAKNPLLKLCQKCGKEKLHKGRGGKTLKPQPYCPKCMAQYQREYREREWARAKARSTWAGMIRRCYDPIQGVGAPPGVPKYADYGAKGVRVMKRWRIENGFNVFVVDVGLPPSRDSTLDRINPKRGYAKSNCRWVDPATQQRNKRSTVWVRAPHPTTGEEIEDTIAGWARRLGIHYSTLKWRLKRWTTQEALSLPVFEPGYGRRNPNDPVPF